MDATAEQSDTRCQPSNTLLIVSFAVSILTALGLMIEVGFGHMPVIYPVLLAAFPVALVVHNADFAKRLFDVVCPTVAMKGVFIAEAALLLIIGAMLPFVSAENTAPRYVIIVMLVAEVALMTTVLILQRLGKLSGANPMCQALFSGSATPAAVSVPAAVAAPVVPVKVAKVF